MHYHFKILEEDNGFSAECCELKGCRTEGDNMAELEKNCSEALNLYLEEPIESKIVFPLPDKKLDIKPELLCIRVEPEIAFAILLKYHRKKSNKSQKQISEMLGMKNIYSYQRLEKKANPSLQTIKKISSIFPYMKLDFILQ